MKPQHVPIFTLKWPKFRGNFDLTDDGDRSCELDDWPMGRWPNKMYFFISGPLVYNWCFFVHCSLFTDFFRPKLYNTPRNLQQKDVVPIQNGLFPVLKPTPRDRGKTPLVLPKKPMGHHPNPSDEPIPSNELSWAEARLTDRGGNVAPLVCEGAKCRYRKRGMR